MDGIGRENIRNTLISVVRYGFGAFFLIMCLGALLEHGYIAVLLFLLAAIIAIPLTATELENRLNVKMSGPVRFLALFVLLIVAASALPPSTNTAVNNSTEPVAAPPSTINSGEATVVPSNNSTEPVAAPPSTINSSEVTAVPSEPVQVATPTSTPTPKNKGKLDLATNPTGATVTIDGVTQGTTPINGLSLDAGTHIVSLYLSGYDLHKETVNLANSETKTILWDFVPDTIQSSTPTPTQEETPTTKVTLTQTSESSNYQDPRWLSVSSSNLRIVANDMTNAGNAATNFDFTSLSIYAKSLFADSQQAIDDSDKYDVSPDLQDIKDEYRLAMVQANWAAVYINSGIEEFNNGNTQAANSDIEQATEYMKSCGQHMQNLNKMLEVYNSKKN